MSIELLQRFLPQNSLSYLQKWLEGHICHIKITKNRDSKLGDYRLMPDRSHQISINGNLEPELFFFVFTHEVAHLLAFHRYKNIAPHGSEWKATFREMLLESILVYSEALRPIILNFAKNPKANYMASPELVKYFDKKLPDNKTYIENLLVGETFIYQTNTYQVEEKKKKRYLCRNLHTGRQYLFKSCARVEKTI